MKYTYILLALFISAPGDAQLRNRRLQKPKAETTNVTPTGMSGASATCASCNRPPIGQKVGGGLFACGDGGLNDLIVGRHQTIVDGYTPNWAGWGTEMSIPGAESLTDGASNTRAIVAALEGDGKTYAANLCAKFQADSEFNTPCRPGNTCYTDWFLPSVEQLRCLYRNREAIRQFDSKSFRPSTFREAINDFYYSSTQDSNDRALTVAFGTVGPSVINKTNRGTGGNVRCVRPYDPSKD